MLNRRQFIRAATGAAMFARIPNVLAAMPAKYDLIIKGGRVINPARKLDAIRDVAIANGRIVKVAPNIPAPPPLFIAPIMSRSAFGLPDISSPTSKPSCMSISAITSLSVWRSARTARVTSSKKRTRFSKLPPYASVR